LRELQSNRRHVIVADQPTLSVIHAIGDLSVSGFTEDMPRPVPTYDKEGRTPVERLISDKE
jgi:hypothetical protein